MSDRPVNCPFCGEHIIYAGHESHEPEIGIVIDNEERIYAHSSCWERVQNSVDRFGRTRDDR